jgi:Spy/CpxP family protein refolding chaperone
MRLKYFLVPVLALVSWGALQAQNAENTDTAPPPKIDDNQGQSPHWRHHDRWIWRQLNLTDAQKGQIKSIRQAMKGQTRPALAAVLKARLKLHQDIEANNEQLFAADTSALATAESQFATVRAAELTQIKGVLTQDQQTLLENLRQKRETRMQEMITKMSQTTS